MRIQLPATTFRARVILSTTAAVLLAGCRGDVVEPPGLLNYPQPPRLTFEAERYIINALDIMETSSIRRHHVDWPALRERTFAAAGPAQKPADTYPALRAAIAELGDRHSSLVTSFATGVPESRTHPWGTTLEGGRVGYVRVPWFSFEDPASHAVEYHTLLRSLDSPAVCGWIVDLRPTAGGNMWPMLAGIGPILGNGTAGYFVNADGNRKPWGYVDGDTYLNGGVYTRMDDPYTLRRPHPPVAVLTNNVTVSSGEAIAVSFRGRPDTRIFGAPTRGLSSGNQGFRLTDNAILLLTTSYMADRNGTSYGGGKLQPDVTVDAPMKDDPAEDAVVAAGRAWLAAHPACAP